MPSEPRSGETRDDYVSRCMDEDKTKQEYPNPNQRAAVCYAYFDRGTENNKAIEASKGKSGKDMSYCNCGTEDQVGGFTCDQHCARAEKMEPAEAKHGGQHGRPGPNDPRKTPAKPSERRRGSKKNPPGSARKSNPRIQVSPQTRKTLRNMVTKHNKGGKGSRATMGMALTVFRRGAGAFSTSHAPNMSRNGWGFARVRAFFYLLRNGRPSNPNYKQDNDLLPRGHPRAKKARTAEQIYEATYEVEAAEYQGRKVTLNKPFRTPDGPKKFAVYVKNESGRVIIVRFGDPNMEIRRDDPARRRNFRSRHNCDSPGPKTKARYWSCLFWSSPTVRQLLKSDTEVADHDCSCGGDCCE